jgi:hypothetical protein
MWQAYIFGMRWKHKDKMYHEDPLKYTRFLNVFARLTREILLLKKHRAESAKAASTQLKQLDHNRELNEAGDKSQESLRHLLGWRSCLLCLHLQGHASRRRRCLNLTLLVHYY